MTPKIALNLSQDGIVLLHRAEDGSGWYEEGRVDFEKDDIDKGLHGLSARAKELEGDGFETKLILPHSQLLFATLALGDDIGKALEELTPYRIDQLSFDVNANGEKVQVVAVAMETLGEAEGFLSKFAFNPVGFTAIPKPGQFDGEPMLSGTLTGPDRFETDKKAVKLLGKRSERTPEPAPKLEPAAPKPEQSNGTDLKVETSAPVEAPKSEAAFSSRRKSEDLTVSAEKKTKKPLTAAPPRISLPENAPKLGAAAPKSGTEPKKSTKIPPTVPPAAPKRDVPKPVLSTGSPTVPKADKKEAAKPDPIAEMAARERKGKPRFLGLILTFILLACLGLAALLSSYLLPPESVSNWFGGNEDFYEELVAEQLGVSDETASTDAQSEAPVALADEAMPPIESEVALSLPEELDLASLPIGEALPELLSEETDFLPEPEPSEAAEIEPIPVAPAPLTEDDVLAAYAATGIWQKMEPFAAPEGIFSTLDNLYVASLPPELKLEDPPALLPFDDEASKLELASVMPPPPPGVIFDLDERGLVRPTAEGALSPLGHLVFLGQPSIRAVPRPSTNAPQPVETDTNTEERDEEQLRLAAIRPTQRPSDFSDQLERERFGGSTLLELSQLRPVQRPASAQAQAEAIARALEEAEADGSQTEASEFAIVASLRANPRPSNFATIVARARPIEPSAQPASAAASLAQPERATGPAVARASRVQPTGPVSRTVARAATETNAISLGRVSLVGVFGTSSNRRALVRMPNGRFVKVSVGDRVDGGRVAAIDSSSLRYVKGGRNLTLKMPQG